MNNETKQNNETKPKKQERSLWTKQQWLDLWELLYADSDIELWDDETIMQCNDPYPGYWFVTNYGRLYSIWNKRIEQIKVETLTNTGTKRDQIVWRYTYNHGGSYVHVTVDKLVDDHFNENQWDDYDGEMNLHHIIGMKHWKSEDVFRASKNTNIQAVPADEVHPFATLFDNDKEMAYLDKKYRRLSDAELQLIEKILPMLIYPEVKVYQEVVDQNDPEKTGVKVVRMQNVQMVEVIEE